MTWTDIVQGYLYPLPESYSAELLDFLHEKGLKTVAGTATPDAEDLAEAQKVITAL